MGNAKPPDTGNDNTGEDEQGLVDDFARIGRVIGLAIRWWTVPVSSAPVMNEPLEVRNTFRISALAIIVALVFSIRPDLVGSVSSIFLGLLLAALVSFGSNLLLSYNIKLSESHILVSYAYLIIVLFLFICFESIVSLNILYVPDVVSYYFDEKMCGVRSVSNCSEYRAFVAFVYTIVVSYPVLIIKSALLDRNIIGLKSMFTGAVILSLFIFFTGLIYIVPESLINSLTR